jgi:arginase
LSAPALATESYNTKLNAIIEFNQQLAQWVEKMLHAQHLPIVLGGDHSIAIGTWQGVCAALPPKARLGLIWVDAHMDAHTPSTSLSQAIHGMPLATLMGYGEATLVQCYSKGTTILPEHLVLIGVRSFEPAEAALLQRLGVKVYTMADIEAQGFTSICEQALAYLTQQTTHLGISIDLDSFDPKWAPGVGSPEPNGLVPAKVMPGLSKLLAQPLTALEIVEYNPQLDKANNTAQLVQELICQLPSEHQTYG